MDDDAVFLDQAQKRLHEHFQATAVRREPSGFPVFALEHCLSHDELDRVKRLLRHRLRYRQRLAHHWLLWAVYAAEVGYGYEGDEYWQSFEEQSPGWASHDRDEVKAWFHKFHQNYRGVLPTGHWADHFTIIAWPITHAIVPKCLQWQFAQTMYDLRYRLASERDFDAQTIGRLFAANASHGSTRFQAFLQQEELTGQVVLALLGSQPTDEEELLHPPTLRRIVHDLEEVRRTRQWLKEARRVVADRFRGIGRGSGPRPPRLRPDAPDHLFPDTAHLTLRPTLFLRHDGADTWTPFLETKSFRGLAALTADLQSFLRRTRCRLNGADDTKPAGWLLSGNRKGVLRSWPDAARPLIEFERDHPVMTHVLHSDCRLSPGPLWLFRIAADGTAREITGRVVRPGGRYIVTTNAPPPQALLDCANPCRLECEGAQSFRLNVPADVSADITALLAALELQVARTIDVWPAGLPGRNWDGEGRTEWLTTETPCLGIAYDHPVDGFDFRLSNGTSAFVPSDSDHGPLFVRLPHLAPGAHHLHVKARRSPDLENVAQTPAAEGFARLDVRQPEPWTPGVTSHPGHEPLPVRWVVRSSRGDIVVRLVDESEHDDRGAELRFYGLESPTKFQPIDSDTARSGITVSPPGGLFLAKHGPHTDAVVVSTPSTGQGFQPLGMTPHMGEPPRGAESLSKLFELLLFWRNARLSGFLVDLRRRKVTTLILERLFAALCGKNWADAEQRFCETPRSQSSIGALAKQIDRRHAFGAALLQPPQPLADTRQLEHWFRANALHARVCESPTLCDFSLRLASHPFATIEDPGFETFLSELIDNPAVFRGARFLLLAGILPSADSYTTPTTSNP